jgi:hypothetical protein
MKDNLTFCGRERRVDNARLNWTSLSRIGSMRPPQEWRSNNLRKSWSWNPRNPAAARWEMRRASLSKHDNGRENWMQESSGRMRSLSAFTATRGRPIPTSPLGCNKSNTSKYYLEISSFLFNNIIYTRSVPPSTYLLFPCVTCEVQIVWFTWCRSSPYPSYIKMRRGTAVERKPQL